jgi:hypothetical protein
MAMENVRQLCEDEKAWLRPYLVYPAPAPIFEEGQAADLRNAVDREQRRPAAWAGTRATEAQQADSPERPVFSRESLPTGNTPACARGQRGPRQRESWRGARITRDSPRLAALLRRVVEQAQRMRLGGGFGAGGRAQLAEDVGDVHAGRLR